MGNILSISMLGVTLGFALTILLQAVKGFFKGWKKALLDLGRTVVAAVIAFLIVFAFCKIYPADTLYKTFIEPATGTIDIVSQSTSIQQFAGRLIYTVAMPFVFTLIFVIFNFILLIPAHFIGKALGIKSKKQIKKERKLYGSSYNDDEKDIPKWKMLLGRFGGAALKALTATLVIMLTLLPFTGLMYTFTDGIYQISSTAADVNVSFELGSPNLDVLGHKITDENGNFVASEAKLIIDETLDPICDNFFLKLSYSAPMRLVYNGMVGTKDAEGNAANEISQIFDVVSDALYFTVDPEDYAQPQKDALTRIFAYVSGSKLHSNIASDVLSGVSKNIINNKTVFNNDFSSLKEDPACIVSEPLLDILSKTTPETVAKDLNTIRDVLIIMIDHKIPGEIAVALAEGNSDNIYGSVADEEMIYKILLTTYHNEDFRHMTGPVIDLMFTVFTRRFDAESQIVRVAGDNINNLTDEDLREEATIFAKLIGNINVVMSSIPALMESNDSMSAIVNMNMADLGHFADTAKDSQFIGTGVTELIIDILESDKMNEMRDVADIMITHLKNDPELDISNLFVAVQGFVSILDKYEKGNGHDTAALAKDLGELNKTFENDSKTADIMKEIINETSIISSSSLSTGGEENTSSQKMMTVFIDQLASKEFTDEELEKEAKALDYSMQLIKASGEEDSSEQLKNIYGGENMNEMIDVMTDSQISSAAINEIAYDENGNKTEDALELSSSMDAEDRENFKTQCEATYNSKLDAFISDPQNTAEDVEEYKNTIKTNMSSLASVFGEELDFDSWDAARA